MTNETYNKISEFIDDDNYTESEKESMWEAIRAYRNDVWHKPDEKPDRIREPILQLHRDMSAGTLFFSMLKGEEEVKMMTNYIVAWCYFEDLLPQWIKVYDYDKQNTKKCVLRDDELKADSDD